MVLIESNIDYIKNRVHYKDSVGLFGPVLEVHLRIIIHKPCCTLNDIYMGHEYFKCFRPAGPNIEAPSLLIRVKANLSFHMVLYNLIEQ